MSKGVRLLWKVSSSDSSHYHNFIWRAISESVAGLPWSQDLLLKPSTLFLQDSWEGRRERGSCLRGRNSQLWKKGVKAWDYCRKIVLLVVIKADEGWCPWYTDIYRFQGCISHIGDSRWCVNEANLRSYVSWINGCSQKFTECLERG